MQVTRIAKVGKEDRFAIFIDGVLKLFLSGQSLLDHTLSIGQDITDDEVVSLTKLSQVDDLYLKSLKYLSLRLRSEGEIRQYLKRKGSTPEQQKAVIDKLKKLDLINDELFARAYIHDRLMLSPSSKRKIAYELRKKQIARDIIESSLTNEQITDQDNLGKLIAIKRRQPKYSDELKLMQYLVRNGFNYGDVKQALKDHASDS